MYWNSQYINLHSDQYHLKREISVNFGGTTNLKILPRFWNLSKLTLIFWVKKQGKSIYFYKIIGWIQDINVQRSKMRHTAWYVGPACRVGPTESVSLSLSLSLSPVTVMASPVSSSQPNCWLAGWTSDQCPTCDTCWQAHAIPHVIKSLNRTRDPPPRWPFLPVTCRWLCKLLSSSPFNLQVSAFVSSLTIFNCLLFSPET